MRRDRPLRVGYVVKRYPRYSETFVVAEIAAHEAAGLEVEIFSLFPPNDTHFHESVRPEDLRRKLADAAAVVTVSGYNWDYLRRAYGAAAARLHRVYNGLDLEQFRYRSPAERPPRIAAVGRLIEKKGFADLVD